MPFDVEQGALADILHQIALAQEFLGERSYDSFQSDTLRVYAVTRCLEII